MANDEIDLTKSPDPASSAGRDNQPSKAEPEPPASHPERRASGRGYRSGTGGDNSPAVIPPDAVKAQVLKHCQRYRKDNRPFSVASLDILEYEHVRNEMGAAAAEQLDRLGKLVCTNTLRGSDRVCFFEPGHAIVLLPDTDQQAARSVMQRITQSIASASLNYRNKPLRASGAFLTASCGPAPAQTSEGDLVVPDAEALLAAVGYKFDEQGNLYNPQLSSMRLFTRKKLTFSGSFTVWSDRYVNMQRDSTDSEGKEEGVPAGVTYIRSHAADQWQAGRRVNIKMFEVTRKDAKFEAEALPKVARRARVLQQIDHPGITRLIDFHSYEQRYLYLVENPTEGTRLTETRADVATALEWGIQLCNSLIYLQGLLPPLVPPRLTEERFYVSRDSQLILVDYEIPYVLGPLCHKADDTPENAALHKSFSMDNLIDFLFVLLEKAGLSREAATNMLGLADKNAVVEAMSTIFKARAILKQALDQVEQRKVSF
ncbi:MAG TPA: diguanylate cyclase [Chroococcales cyanobacterium]